MNFKKTFFPPSCFLAPQANKLNFFFIFLGQQFVLRLRIKQRNQQCLVWWQKIFNYLGIIWNSSCWISADILLHSGEVKKSTPKTPKTYCPVPDELRFSPRKNFTAQWSFTWNSNSSVTSNQKEEKSLVESEINSAYKELSFWDCREREKAFNSSFQLLRLGTWFNDKHFLCISLEAEKAETDW